MQPDSTTPLFEGLPLVTAQALLWDFYRTWAISAAEHATTELKGRLIFYEQQDDLLTASYATPKLIEETA